MKNHLIYHVHSFGLAFYLICFVVKENSYCVLRNMHHYNTIYENNEIVYIHMWFNVLFELDFITNYWLHCSKRMIGYLVNNRYAGI